MKTILECKNLTKRYGRTQALSGINLSLKAGRIIGLLGPNGSGKTTMIKLINGLLTPTGGRNPHRRHGAGREDQVHRLLSSGADLPG